MTTALTTIPAVPVGRPHDTPPTFEYIYVPINDLAVELTEDEATGKPVVESVVVAGEPMQPTSRFWTSLFARYGFNKAFFKYFNHAEVFDRIHKHEANDRMRVCVERSERGDNLLAVSSPTRPVVTHSNLMELLNRYDGQSITYHGGIVESTHTPRSGSNRSEILGDLHDNQFVLQTPIDGYGMPSMYLSMLRLACLNGVVGYHKLFKSTLALGKEASDTIPSLTRALEGFSSDEGHAALRSRIKSSGSSWLSIYESQQLYKLVVKLLAQGLLTNSPVQGTAVYDYLVSDAKEQEFGENAVGSPIIKAFHKMTGDPAEAYGLANLDGLSPKRQRTLPVKCTVYDALNFATEVATHYSDSDGSRQMQAWVGRIISEEYDMEGTKEQFTDFADFMIDSKIRNGLTGSGSLS
jgi:hypothetical protein